LRCGNEDKERGIEMRKVKELQIKASLWAKAHRYALVIFTSFWLVILIIHFFGWWEALGILFLKFGLGIKVAGAKTLARAITKAGGKKAIAVATAGMLAKRHFIDVASKFFIEHSVEKYKNNLIKVFRIKWEEFKGTSLVKKIQAFGIMLLSIPGVYFFWTKVISVAVQKFVYALIVPLFTLVWSLVSGIFNFLGFVLEILALNVLLEAIQNYEWGKKVVKAIDSFIYFIGDIFSYINKGLKWFLALSGIDFNPKSYLIKKSIDFNRWLEKILDKGLNKVTKVKNQRDRYVNIVEKISEKRYLYSQKRMDKKLSFWITFKKSYKKKVLKEKTWREKRQERLEKQKQRILKKIQERRKQKIKQRKDKRKSLILPYYELVRYGEVPFRPR